MAVSEEYRLWIVDQLSTVAPVRTRRMFGGLGIYAGDLFFAIADDDVLYFKVSDATRPEYEAAGAHPFQPSPDAPEMTGYWSVPADVLENTETLAGWMTKAVGVAREAAERRPRAASPGRKRRVRAGMYAALGLGGALLGLAFARRSSAPAPPRPPDEPLSVSTALVSRRTLRLELRAKGNVEAARGVPVRALVTATVARVHVKPGQSVKKGDVLVTLDAEPLEIAVRNAEAESSREVAALKQADASLARDRGLQKAAEADAARLESLFAQDLVPRARLEEQRKAVEALGASLKASEAALAAARTRVRAAEAEVEAARVRLAQAVVCAPVPGRIGSSVVTAGVVARAGDASPLVTITPPSPVTVEFAVPEQEIARLHEAAESGRVRVAAEPEDERARPVPGTLSWVASSSDASTKTVRVRASFENADRTLHAGEPVRLTLVLAPSAETTVVPAQAVQKGLEGTFVYVLEKDHTVQPRPVTTGPTVEELTVVEKGLEPGERVVIDNQRRLYAGARVEPKPS